MQGPKCPGSMHLPADRQKGMHYNSTVSLNRQCSSNGPLYCMNGIYFILDTVLITHLRKYGKMNKVDSLLEH